jgi:hypothetical protein
VENRYSLTFLGREVFLHETITASAAEIEDIVGILVEQLEVALHSLANVFVDDLGILPSPFRVEVGITDDVKGRSFAKVGFIVLLPRAALDRIAPANRRAARVVWKGRISNLRETLLYGAVD